MRSRILLLLALLFFALPAWANSLILDATDESVELVTSSTAGIDYTVSYVDNTTTAFTPGSNQGAISTATTTTILSAPAASTQRQMKWLSVRNTDGATTNVVTVQMDKAATNRVLTSAISLAAGESFTIDHEGLLTVFTSAGLIKQQATSVSFDITDTDSSPIRTVDQGEQIQYAGAGTVSVDLTGAGSNHVVTVTGSAHTADEVGAVTNTDVCQGDGSQVQCNIATLANLNTALGSSVADGPHFSPTAGISTDHGAGAITATTDFAGTLCGTNQILEDQGATWACIATPSGGTETNTLTTVTTGIAEDQVPVGNTGTSHYETLPNGVVAYNTTTDVFSAAADVAQIEAPASDDQALVSDSTAASTWRTIPDCHTNNMLTYTQATNTFGCDADDGGGGGTTVSIDGVSVGSAINFDDGGDVNFTNDGDGTASTAVTNVQCSGSCIGDAEVDNNISIDHSSTGTLLLDQTVGPSAEGLIAWDPTNDELEIGNGAPGTEVFKPIGTFTNTAICKADTGANTIDCSSTTLALSTETTGNYMVDVTLGAGIGGSHTPSHGSTATIATASQEAGFLADGGVTALTCGASNQGKAQVMDDGTLQFCDGATTSAQQTAVNLGGTQTITGDKTFSGTSLNVGATGWTNANHAHTAASSGGQIAFSSLTGTVGDTQIAAGAVDGGSGGEIADGSIDSNDVAASLKTEVGCAYVETPAVEVLESVWRAPVAVTITEIWCEVDAGTVGMDLQNDDGTPTGVNGSDVSCATPNGTSDATFAGDATLAQNDRIDLDINSVTSATKLSVCWRYTYD